MSAVEPAGEGRVMVPVENMVELDRLEPEAREIAITRMLDQARHWLAHAKEASAPAREIADFRAFVASAADAARRVKVSKEIQLDADEMVRRSERALGLSIREGQANGEIETKGQARVRAGLVRQQKVDNILLTGQGPVPVASIAPPDVLIGNGTGALNLTDDVTDEQFETALAAARAEGNLSRANVVRRAQNPAGADVVDRIREMAAEGYTTRQISKALGLDQEGVAWRAKRYDIEIPADRVVGRTRHHDSNRILRESVSTLEGVAMGIELVDVADLDPAEIQNWTDSLTASIRALNRLNRRMKETIQ